MKKCIKCQIEKDESEFYKQANKNLTIGTCKKCHSKIMTEWQKNNYQKCKKSWTKFNRKRCKGRICEWCGNQFKIANSQKGCSLKCRFELSIEKKETGCWHWIKGTCGNKKFRYGQMSIEGKHIRATKISYELHKGIVPEGKMVLHTCDNPICVNPDHLYIGDHQQNMDDMNSRGRGNTGRIHFRKASYETCKEVLKLRTEGKIYKEISLLTGIKESNCKFICKYPERIKYYEELLNSEEKLE